MANIDYTNFEYYKLSDVNHDGVQYPGAVVQKNGAVYADQIIWGKVTIDGNEKDKATTQDVLTALENSGSIDPQDLWGEFDPGTKLTYHKKVTLGNGSEVNIYGESSDKYRLTRPEENDLIDNEEEEEDEEDTVETSPSPTTMYNVYTAYEQGQVTEQDLVYSAKEIFDATTWANDNKDSLALGQHYEIYYGIPGNGGTYQDSIYKDDPVPSPSPTPSPSPSPTPSPSPSPTPDPSVSPSSTSTTSAPTLRPGEGIGVAAAVKYDDLFYPLNKKTGTDYYELDDTYTYFMLYTDNDDIRESITVNIGNLQFT